MFISIHRWIALGIVVGTFSAGWVGGYVMRGEGLATGVPAACASVPPAEPEKPAPPPPGVQPVAPVPPPSVVVNVVTEPGHRVTAKAEKIPFPKPPPPPEPLKPATPATPAKAVAPGPDPAPNPTSAPEKAAPASPDPTSTPTPGHYYKVQAGDTLTALAVRAYGSAKRANDLLKANPAVDPFRMRVGLTIYIPVRDETSPPTPAAAETHEETAAAK